MDSGFLERQQLAVNLLPLNQVKEHFGLLNQPDNFVKALYVYAMFPCSLWKPLGGKNQHERSLRHS